MRKFAAEHSGAEAVVISARIEEELSELAPEESAEFLKDMGVSDPGAIVWDEVIAIWLIFFLIMPTGFWGQLTAFALFRFFDIVKPGPVGWADQLFKGFGWRGGWGIIWDDLVAAFCTLMTIALLRWL